MSELSLLTVPVLRSRCKELGLPAYQRRGKRLRKQDLIDQIDSYFAAEASRAVSAQTEAILDHWTSVRHAEALGWKRDRLLEHDARTMHRILRGVDRPTDQRHWSTKATIRGLVAASMSV